MATAITGESRFRRTTIFWARPKVLSKIYKIEEDNGDHERKVERGTLDLGSFARRHLSCVLVLSCVLISSTHTAPKIKSELNM